jgi:LuxR family quorum sensing-dependent transcriptional regulator
MADAIMMISMPQGYSERYIERNYVTRDPMILEMFRTFQPYAWSDVLARGEFKKDDVHIVYEASEFAMNNGYIVPIYGDDGYCGMVSCSGEKPELDSRSRSAMQLAGIYAHNKVLALRRRQDSEAVQLTDRERECLCWASEGKSDWEIGEILGVSQKTVNFHMENAKRKYKVKTRMQAVIGALRQGVLFPNGVVHSLRKQLPGQIRPDY